MVSKVDPVCILHIRLRRGSVNVLSRLTRFNPECGSGSGSGSGGAAAAAAAAVVVVVVVVVVVAVAAVVVVAVAVVGGLLIVSGVSNRLFPIPLDPVELS